MLFVDFTIKKEQDPVTNGDHKIKEEITTPVKIQRSNTAQHKFDHHGISIDKIIRDNNNNETNKRTKTSPASLPVSVSAVKSAPITPVTAPPVTAPPVTAPTVAKQQVTAKAPSVAVPPVTALPVTALPVTATSVTALPVTAPPVIAFPVTATPVTIHTVAKQPVTVEASGQGRLVAYQQPGVITVTLTNSPSVSGIQISTSTSNNNFPTSLMSSATTSTNSSTNMSSSADQLSRTRVHLKPIRKGQSNADNTPPSNRTVVWPLYQHVWRSKPWTNFTSFNQTTSTQSRKRKASDTDDGHQQQTKSAKETEESRPGGATQTSGPNCHIAASTGVTGVKDTTVPMLEIHRKTKRNFAVKIRVPSKEYPWVNYPGKLIGVKGTTIKQLERLTRCKLTIRGKGCFSSRTWEEQSQEDLHILVECFADTGDAYGRFARAIEILQEFIKSDADPVLLLREMRFQPNYFSGQVSPDQVSTSQVSQNWQYWQPNYNNYTNYTRW